MRRSILVLLLVIPQATWSAGHRLEITPMIGLRGGGSIIVEDRTFRREDIEVGVTTGTSYGIRCDLRIGKAFELEGALSHLGGTFMDEKGLFGEQPGGFFMPGERKFLDVSITSYQIGLLWFFHNGWSRDYIVAAGGMTGIHPSLGLAAATRMSASGGAGLMIDFNDLLGLRLEGRLYWTDTDENVQATQQFEHRDCIQPCTYTYRYTPRLIQSEIALGLTVGI